MHNILFLYNPESNVKQYEKGFETKQFNTHTAEHTLLTTDLRHQCLG